MEFQPLSTKWEPEEVKFEEQQCPVSMSSPTDTSAGPTEEASFQCQHCYYRCLGQHRLDHHMRQQHPRVNRPGDFRCDVCSYTTNRPSDLRRHQASKHSGKRPYRCQQCDRAFAVLSTLQRHAITHQTELPYKCDICGKQCAQKSNLTRHLRLHTGETIVRCDICDVEFNDRTRYNEHMRVHTGNLQECAQCPRRFATRRDLERHVRTHTRPFVCAVCEKRFSESKALAHHMAKRHSQLPGPNNLDD